MQFLYAQFTRTLRFHEESLRCKEYGTINVAHRSLEIDWMFAVLVLLTVLLSSCSSPSQEANSSPPSATPPAPQGTPPLPAQTTSPASTRTEPAPAPTQTTSASSTTQEPITVMLAWDPNDSSVKGYKVHFGTSSRQYDTHQDVGNVTTFVSYVSGGYTWYFTVSAYNGAGESPLSQELATPSP